MYIMQNEKVACKQFWLVYLGSLFFNVWRVEADRILKGI